MKKIFACPHCHAVLNPSVKILLVVGHKRRKGMILLSPQPGNYKYICDESFEENLQVGDKLKFSCPVCSKSMTSSRNKNFVAMVMTTPGQEPQRVEFSRLYGKNATFVYDSDGVKAYGDDVDDSGSTNFFGA
jgi:hypothetical protein